MVSLKLNSNKDFQTLENLSDERYIRVTVNCPMTYGTLKTTITVQMKHEKS